MHNYLLITRYNELGDLTYSVETNEPVKELINFLEADSEESLMDLVTRHKGVDPNSLDANQVFNSIKYFMNNSNYNVDYISSEEDISSELEKGNLLLSINSDNVVELIEELDNINKDNFRNWLHQTIDKVINEEVANVSQLKSDLESVVDILDITPLDMILNLNSIQNLSSIYGSRFIIF